jgi:hypothetical protein
MIGGFRASPRRLGERRKGVSVAISQFQMWTQSHEDRPVLSRETTAPPQAGQTNAVAEVTEIDAQIIRDAKHAIVVMIQIKALDGPTAGNIRKRQWPIEITGFSDRA